MEEIGVGDFAPMDDGEVTFLTFAIAVREAEFFLKRGKGVRRIWAGTFHPDYMKIAEEYAVPISFASGAAEPRGCDNKKPYRS